MFKKQNKSVVFVWKTTHQNDQHDHGGQQSSSQENKDNEPVRFFEDAAVYIDAILHDVGGSGGVERPTGGTLDILLHHTDVLHT